MTTTAAVVAVAAFVAMEPAVAWVHRRVMHGPGWSWHRSHHRGRAGGLEANDLYPVVFAAGTVAAIALGTAVDDLVALRWAGAGVTAYGLSYLLVHDLYIHERLGPLPGGRSRYVRWVAAAHAVHHHAGGRAPYGFLLPVARAARPATDLTGRRREVSR